MIIFLFCFNCLYNTLFLMINLNYFILFCFIIPQFIFRHKVISALLVWFVFLLACHGKVASFSLAG